MFTHLYWSMFKDLKKIWLKKTIYYSCYKTNDSVIHDRKSQNKTQFCLKKDIIIT